MCAEHYAGLLIDEATQKGLVRWRAYSRGYKGALAIQRGEIAAGLQLLRVGFDEFGGFTTFPFMDVLVPRALGLAGEVAKGLALVDEAISRSEQAEEYRFTAELLRSKGELLLLQAGSRAAAEAEDLFWHALDLAHRQGALSLELRVATSLARQLRKCGCSHGTLAFLQPIYDRFTEGFDTADLKAARLLLNDLL